MPEHEEEETQLSPPTTIGESLNPPDDSFQNLASLIVDVRSLLWVLKQLMFLQTHLTLAR
jgi:hypothetical protein